MGLLDRRLNEPSHRRAPVDEVIALQELYASRYRDWNVRHFHRWYQREHEGSRSYSWVKSSLQNAGLVRKAKTRGPHRIKRLASALPGMMIHQDGSTHQWVPSVYWDLIVTMDDATNKHYSMRFVDEEGTHSSLLGVKDVLEANGLIPYSCALSIILVGLAFDEPLIYIKDIDMKKLLLAAVLAAVALPATSSEWTASSSIRTIQSATAVNSTYVRAVGSFGPAGCPAAQYVILNDSLAAYKILMAEILTAKASGSKISVFGTCVDATYFSAEQVRLD